MWEPGARDEDQQARWLLAYLLDWHRREDKAGWWEYFQLLDLPEEDLFDEPQAIADFEFVKRVETTLSKRGKPTGSVIDWYRYPTQEMEIRRGHELKLKTEEKFGEVVRVNRAEHSIDIRKGRRWRRCIRLPHSSTSTSTRRSLKTQSSRSVRTSPAVRPGSTNRERGENSSHALPNSDFGKIGTRIIQIKLLICLVGAQGFEPWTR